MISLMSNDFFCDALAEWMEICAFLIKFYDPRLKQALRCIVLIIRLKSGNK